MTTHESAKTSEVEQKSAGLAVKSAAPAGQVVKAPLSAPPNVEKSEGKMEKGGTGENEHRGVRITRTQAKLIYAGVVVGSFIAYVLGLLFSLYVLPSNEEQV